MEQPIVGYFKPLSESAAPRLRNLRATVIIAALDAAAAFARDGARFPIDEITCSPPYAFDVAKADMPFCTAHVCF